MAVKGSYTWADLIKALRDVDIQQGDTVFLHVSLDALGTSPGESTEDLTAALFYSTMRQAVGEAGTLVVPSYTFSFCHQELFDVEKTPSRGGPWSTSANILEYFRQLPGATRSQDPIHSVVAIGPRAKELVTDVPSTCFGEGSVFDRLRRAGGKICTIGVGLRE